VACRDGFGDADGWALLAFTAPPALVDPFPLAVVRLGGSFTRFASSWR